MIPPLPADDPSTPSDLQSVDSHEGFNDNAETQEEEENRYLQNSMTLARAIARPRIGVIRNTMLN